MKTRLYFLALILTFIGFCPSCQKADMDKSAIDYSNIEYLYEAPLPVIKKCVQGKWKWYVSYGGDEGASYSENTFVDIDHNRLIIDYDDGGQRIIYYTWKKYTFLTMNMEYIRRWVMWNTEQDRGIWYFSEIKNDTLQVGNIVSVEARDIPSGSAFVRVK